MLLLLGAPAAQAKGGKQLYPAATQGRYGFIDERGKTAIPPQFDEAHSFREGFASVRVQNKWGFIDSKGKWLVEPGYEAASSFFEGLAAVRLGGKVGFINTKGKVAVQPAFTGRLMSIRIRSGGLERAMSTPSWPSIAISTS